MPIASAQGQGEQGEVFYFQNFLGQIDIKKSKGFWLAYAKEWE
ncbi:hypothetical protein [Porphyrobacter sp. ULC335]|nr:hypothetical protein [Porphyrobacter sp. ULC335]